MTETERVWVHDRRWEVLPANHGKQCRSGPCRQPAVARLWRKGRRRSGWWTYCANHLYGRRIEGDKVLCSVHPESICAERGYAD